MAAPAPVLSVALRDAAARGDVAHVTRLLANHNCAVNAVDENGYSALQRAAADGHVDVVRLLLQYKADCNGQDHMHGNTALHEASWKGYSRCVALLASHKANMHIKNYGGFAALHLSCQNGHNQTCREILLAGCDPDLQNNYGDTSLHTSARYGHAGVTRILISAECKVSIQNKNGDTALHIAAAMGRRKLTRILLEAGCDKSLKNKQNETARDIAMRKQLTEILDILNIPSFKAKKEIKKREKFRDKSRDREIDVPDSSDREKKKKTKEKDVIISPSKSKEKKKTKNVHFEPAQKWSPYGCHYYPDPKTFPKPKLDSLPTEPLKKGEQYYLDLAGNICKGPVGVGYTCYCAPFFRHMEDKLDRDKRELKQHIDKAHEKLDQKVNDLEMKTQGQISELTRCMAAERVLCRERHLHLEQWLTRGMIFRQSERVKKLDFSPKGSVDIPPIKRTRSLEILDSSRSYNKVNQIIRTFNRKGNEFENGGKVLKSAMRKSSRSAELLDVEENTERKPFRNRTEENCLHLEIVDSIPIMINQNKTDRMSIKSSGKSTDILNYSTDNSNYQVDSGRSSSQNVIAEIHIKPNNILSLSHSPMNQGVDKIVPQSPSKISGKSTPSILSKSDQRNSDSDYDIRNQRSLILNGTSSQDAPVWKSEVLQRTADVAKKRAIVEHDIARKLKITKDRTRIDEIVHDGYIKFPKQPIRNKDSEVDKEAIYAKQTSFIINEEDSGKRKSVQEIAAEIEQIRDNTAFTEISRLTDPKPVSRSSRQSRSRSLSPVSNNSENIQTSSRQFQPSLQFLSPSDTSEFAAKKILTNKQNPSEKIQKLPISKKFSFQNLIPFPTRKAFQVPQNTNGNNSESSDEEDIPIRTSLEPGLMRNANLIKGLSLPNYEHMRKATINKQVAQPQVNHMLPSNFPSIPKDAYFHEIPHRQHFGDPRFYHSSNQSLTNGIIEDNTNLITNLPPTAESIYHSRNRNPLHGSTGLFDAMMQDHMSREVERIPHLYGYRENNAGPNHIRNSNASINAYTQNNDSPVGHAGGMNYALSNPQINLVNRGTDSASRQRQTEPNELRERMQTLAINTQLTELQSQLDRDSHNDSGYSTKVYSSQGPSPSLSGHLESIDIVNQKLPPLPPNKHSIKHSLNQVCQYNTSSLV